MNLRDACKIAISDCSDESKLIRSAETNLTEALWESARDDTWPDSEDMNSYDRLLRLRRFVGEIESWLETTYCIPDETGKAVHPTSTKIFGLKLAWRQVTVEDSKRPKRRICVRRLIHNDEYGWETASEIFMYDELLLLDIVVSLPMLLNQICETTEVFRISTQEETARIKNEKKT